MRRPSIRNLMAVIFLAAVGLLALRNANALWAALAFLTAFVTVCVSAAGALRGRERSWYASYAVVCGTYLLLAFTPIAELRLPTTYLLNGVYARSVGAQASMANAHRFWSSYSYAKDEIQRLKAMKRGPGDREFDALTRMLRRLESPPPKMQAAFVATGHSLFAVRSEKSTSRQVDLVLVNRAR